MRMVNGSSPGKANGRTRGTWSFRVKRPGCASLTRATLAYPGYAGSQTPAILSVDALSGAIQIPMFYLRTQSMHLHTESEYLSYLENVL